MGMNGLKGRGPRRKKTTDEKIKRQQGKLKDVDRGENGGEEGRKIKGEERPETNIERKGGGRNGVYTKGKDERKAEIRKT